MNLKRILPTVLSAVLLASAFTVCALYGQREQPKPVVSEPSAASTDSEADLQPMKGVWLTHMELSMEGEADKSKKAFEHKFSDMIKKCKEFGFNCVVVQVRPFCDAMYKSSYFPYSHILTGTQGKDPGYDPLKQMCEICHRQGIRLHAWINPYRVSLNNVPAEWSDDNPAVKEPDLLLTTGSTTILDPSNEKARELIVNGVSEIVENYDVDGIQFDDYFYPTDINDLDREQYQTYASKAGDNAMSLSDWRKVNVNMLVAQTYIAIHRSKKAVVFGISPQGNLENNDALSADVISWCCNKGYIDYICPQLYFSLDNPKLRFEDALKSWTELDLAKDMQLYIGLAGYKAGTDEDEGTWEKSENILKEEYKILKKNNKVGGFMLYSYSSLLSDKAESEIQSLKQEMKLK